MSNTRVSGVLLHPTSLPGRFGIGEFNAHAYCFVDFLARARQGLWQVLPLGPTGYGDSPYQCFSAFAGNPLLIGLDQLVADGLLAPSDLNEVPAFSEQQVDYGAVIPFKHALLRKAYQCFASQASPQHRQAFAAFSAQHAGWLDDFALFMALKNAHGGQPWNTWERDIRLREPGAVATWRAHLPAEVEAQQFYQFLFFKQWRALKTYANERDIRIVGDIPIFVANDSADAWSHRELFYFDADGNSTVIAGVPPDYFSPTGQRWGNPLYRWDVMQAQGFAWWIERCRAAFEMYDLTRIDHFRGFQAYWEVPASEPTAMNGRWVEAPGMELFRTLERALRPPSPPAQSAPPPLGEGSRLPIIAEDLGVITPEVTAIRDAFGFPGMRIFQFAFVADTAPNFLPRNYIPHCVAYVGTHDNNTTMGWFSSLDAPVRAQVLEYTGSDGSEIEWVMMRKLLESAANTAVVTMQDLLGLGEDARMNLPGRPGGNWTWRFTPEQLTGEMEARLRDLTLSTGRAAAH
jgi:4-alpha-glucanotransferase